MQDTDRQHTNDDQPIAARLVSEPAGIDRLDVDEARTNPAVADDMPLGRTMGDESVIREGSPFRVDPIVEELPLPAAPPEAFYDLGPARYMALGSVVAAIVVMIFGALSLVWFPGGGVMVSGLGCVLGIAGLMSPRPRIAGGLLLGHVGLFVASYARMMGN